MLHRNRRLAATAAMGVVALTLAACGSDNPTATDTDDSSPAASSLSGELVGAGASSQESAMAAWIAEFQGANPDVNVSYDPVGSGGGRTQFIDGGTNWAGSDAYLDDEEIAAATETCGGEVMELPIYISPIAVIYNLPEVTAEHIQMSADTLAKVFSGEITKWNDAAIVAENEGVELPDTAITVVHRSDESGTTENFTEYLSMASSAWPHEASGDWPVAGQQSAQGTSGVVQTVEAAPGTIGYADASQAGGLGTVAVGVGDEYVPYSAEAAAAVVDASTRVEGRGEYDFAIELARDTTESGAYPVVLVSYVVACTAFDDADKADLVKSWLTYIASSEGQAVAAESAGSAPISDSLRDDAMSAINAISAS